MKFIRTLTFHGVINIQSPDDVKPFELAQLTEFEDDHPLVQYFRADGSALRVVVVVEDGTVIDYNPINED